MAGIPYTSSSQPVASVQFNGGLNSTAGSLSLKDNEASDLQNIDFDKFGSILKRGGYTPITADHTAEEDPCDGLYWFEYISAGTPTRHAIYVGGGKLYKMDALDGTWDDITGSVTLTAGYHCDFETFNNKLIITNGKDTPIMWTGTGNAIKMPQFVANSYTFTVYGITTAPLVGDKYTNNGVTYTIVYIETSGGATDKAGTIVATGSGVPEVTGTLTKDTSVAGDASILYSEATANINIASAKYVCVFNNFLFFLNIVIGSTYYNTRAYWSSIRNIYAFAGDQWVEVGLNDGQEITRGKVLSDRMAVYKERSVYNIYYTGDSDIPFIMPGGGKSTSNVGCVAPWSIQEVENGHVFLAPDGLYYYDGAGSTKLSYRVAKTLNEFNEAYFANSVSTTYKIKNMYYLTFSYGASSTANRILVWDYFNNAFSIYVGMAPSAMATFFADGITEKPYFGDYNGWTYEMDDGHDDYPLNVQTAVDTYYYTNWKHFDDLCDQKGIPNIYVYYQTTNGVLTIAFSYDFETGDQFTQTMSMATGTSVYGSAIYGTGIYSGAGGAVKRRDITGRGRVVRFKFANNTLGEQFQLDGFGSLVHLETNV
jgi:hypothetical protein